MTYRARQFGLSAAIALLPLLACTGPDHLTEPVVSQGGSYFTSLGGQATVARGGSTNVGAVGGADAVGGARAGLGAGGQGNGGNGSGGIRATGGVAAGSPTAGGSVAATGGAASFAWGNNSYDVNGGANVAYQGHFPGMACLAACHSHSMTVAGTAYQKDGTATAASVQIGLLINGSVVSAYSGSQGNFYATIPGVIDWANTSIAVRSAAGTKTMQPNANANGNCNSCHDSTQRIIVP